MDMGDVFVGDTHGDCVLSFLKISHVILFMTEFLFLSFFLVVSFVFCCKSSLTAWISPSAGMEQSLSVKLYDCSGTDSLDLLKELKLNQTFLRQKICRKSQKLLVVNLRTEIWNQTSFYYKKSDREEELSFVWIQSKPKPTIRLL